MKLPLFISAFLLVLLTSCYGAQQTINIGTTPSDGTGDSLRTAFGKVNTNFTELYSLTSAINASNITTGTLPIARIADGSVTNAKLANSAITINGSAVSLGQSISVSASTNLTGLTDVTITSAATNDFLVKSAGDWVNLTPASARTALGLSSAGGVLSGNYPSPGFAVDMAEQGELNTAIAGRQPLDSDLTAIAALTTTPFGRELLTMTTPLFFNRLTVARTDNDYATLVIDSANSGAAVFSNANLTDDRAYEAPDGNGTLALTSQLSGQITVADVTGLAASATTDTTSAGNITSGTLPIARIADGSVTNAKLAGSIALSKLAITGTADGTKFLRDDGSWQAVNLSAYLPLAGGTMTGALNINAGTATASAPPINITQTWNNAGVTFRGIEYAATNTASNTASTLIRLLNGATTAFSVNASTGSLSAGTNNNSATITLQGSDRSAVMNLGVFGNEFRLASLQLGHPNAALRFTDVNAAVRYGTIWGETTDVLALRNGSGGTTGAAWEMLEMTAPGTPSADRGRLYLEDNGSGKSRLVVKWADGTTSVIVTQP